MEMKPKVMLPAAFHNKIKDTVCKDSALDSAETWNGLFNYCDFSFNP